MSDKINLVMVTLSQVKPGQKFQSNGRWYVKGDSDGLECWCETEDKEDSDLFVIFDTVFIYA